MPAGRGDAALAICCTVTIDAAAGTADADGFGAE